MPFENISKRKLAFAPQVVVIKGDQPEYKIAIHETNFSRTEHISAPNKMIYMTGSGKPGEFEKLPELIHIEGNLSVAENVTVLAAKLAMIDGDLHVLAKARFYAPLLEKVTGFIYLGEGATVNAPKIEPMLVNDDTSKIQQQADADWLNTLAN
jgi:hypothetical protein